MNTTNQVRQVLMNELGLTREVIREEMTKIIEDTIKKHINDLNCNKVIEKMVAHEIDQVFRMKEEHSRFFGPSVKDIVRAEIKTQVEQMVKEKISIELKL